MSVRIPDRFPFAGSGPSSRDYRYELLDYRPDAPTTGASWQKLEDAVNYIRGKHKKEFPALVLKCVFYDGANHPMANCARIYLGPKADWLDCTFYVDRVAAADYTFSISESAGGNSTDVVIPMGTDKTILKAMLSLSGAGVAFTTISISGNAAVGSHPNIYTAHFRVAQELRY